MDLLQVRGDQIVDVAGRAVRLRGTCVGGWMNMENFINDYPGVEHGLRAAMAEALGPELGAWFFDRWHDHFFTDDDVAFITSCGANVVRLPLNYRHFERDDQPFVYLDAGFARLDRALASCERHGLYAILDLHAVQGWQNPDWHCDNASRHALFWQHAHFQDRFVAWWEQLARRYRDRAVVAGYNVMNEPVNGAPRGRFSHAYRTNWPRINAVYRRVVEAIRAIDSRHIIFLEGDCFSTRFEGLDPPFADHLVYSTHNYTSAGFGPGPYPGAFEGEHWDRAKQRDVILNHEGTRFARTHRVPLWAGELGSVYNGPEDERPDRLRALDDELDVLNELGIHWTTWTYKDVGAMGWVHVDPESPYRQRTAAVRVAKRQLATEYWMYWLPPTNAQEILTQLSQLIERSVPRGTVDLDGQRIYLTQAVCDNFIGSLLQPAFAKAFAGSSQEALDQALRSFAFAQCRPFAPLIDVVTRRMTAPI